MTEEEMFVFLGDMGCGWLMDISDEMCQSNAIRALVEYAEAAERERCAKLCERLADEWNASREFDTGDAPNGHDCASAIRKA